MAFRDEKKAAAAQKAEGLRTKQSPTPVGQSHPPQRASSTRPAQTGNEDSGNYSAGFVPEIPELGTDDDAPPAYSEFHDQLDIHQAGFDAGAVITDDGRINININQTSRRLADFIAPTLRSQLEPEARPSAGLPPPYIPPSLGGQPGQTPPPRLNIVIQIVGSRGDVQPFIALGQVLKNTYGHRIRIATHATFQKFVEENGLEFFSIGGDPAELMAFMVKNPGLMPGFGAVKSGEIAKRRKGIETIIMGCWRSCIETGDGLGPAPRFDRRDDDDDYDTNLVAGDSRHKPFVADAVIANPPSFAHVHIAEKLGVPLHLMFTMPWSPTRAFPQPLANIQSSNTDSVTTNYISYALVEMMTWQGLGDVINRFRSKILDLEPLSLMWAPAVLTRLRIPYTYCWSPALIPKPNDWGNHIDIAGFYFLNLASSYTPDPELAAFLAAGPPPVYIGFGSIVVDDPDELTKKIFEAVADVGVRALVSKGWGGLGADSMGIPDGVFMLGNVPHDWLFNHVSAVCHHGGAGTTATGIRAGKPTIVVPFFGDQPFWGAMVARAGAGPDPIPYKQLTSAKLAEAIRTCLKPETLQKARELGEKIREEKGSDVGGQSFHEHLDVDSLRCAIAPSRVAVWRVRRSKTHLSALGAAVLVNNGYVRYSDLKLFRAKEYQTERHPTDPISACTSALVGDITTVVISATDIHKDLFKAAVAPLASKSTDNVAGGAASSETSFESPRPSKSPEATSSTVAGPDSTSVNRRLTTNSNPQSPRATSSTAKATTTQSEVTNQQLESLLDTGRSINNIISTGVKSPMNFCMGIAKGFRNAPNLYNDDTVRLTEKVTDFRSGLKVAGKEFGFGLYDGITGLVTQPIKGAQKEGGAGFVKGFGKGIGGLILKPSAAVWSLPAYTMAGVHAEIRTMFAQSAERYIVASRIAQGNHEFNDSSTEERDDIEARWLEMKDNMKGFYLLKQKEKAKSKAALPTAPKHATVSSEDLGDALRSDVTRWFRNKLPSADERSRLQGRQNERGGASSADGAQSVSSSGNGTRELDEEFENAIQVAVRETSRGDAVEDSRVEQAIRSSVGIIRERRPTAMDQFALPNWSSSDVSAHRSEWVPEVKNPSPDETSRYPFSPDDLEGITDEEYQALIEEAIKLSIAEQQQQQQQQHGFISMHDFEDGDDNGESSSRPPAHSSFSRPDDDEDYQRALAASQHDDNVNFDEEALRQAIEASRAEQGRRQFDEEEDEELRRVLQESENAHRQEQARINSLRSEEDIVMEYVKKQSLAEAAYRAAREENTGDDEDLRRVLEESMKTDDELRRGGGGGPSHS
ncbi:hypothetical protein GGR50DRAFT_461116 [Xylaria sp. CBS 124048]|nr:hypothetical protein GGR50DRAFT_461116 [Xylaria sp. CBS 124048]